VNGQDCALVHQMHTDLRFIQLLAFKPSLKAGLGNGARSGLGPLVGGAVWYLQVETVAHRLMFGICVAGYFFFLRRKAGIAGSSAV
jgi:hypothetical protein